MPPGYFAYTVPYPLPAGHVYLDDAREMSREEIHKWIEDAAARGEPGFFQGELP